MKKIVITLYIALLAGISANAQIMDAIYSDDFPGDAKVRAGIHADYDLNSNALTNALVAKFYRGGYIDNDIKKVGFDELKNFNRVGGNYSYGIYAAIKPDSVFHKKHISFFLSVRDRLHVDARFPRDLFTLGFYGNAQFAGKTAYLTDFNLNLLRYQQLQVGMVSSNLDSVARWGVAVSFLKGQEYLSVLANKAELFTSADGQYIDLNTELLMVKSDTSKSGYAAFNGGGASVDIFFEAPFETRLGPARIRMSVSDIGMIRYNNETLRFKQDSLLHYSGIYINNLTNIQSSSGENIKDSIVNTIVPNQKAKYSATLPAVLDVAYTTEISSHFHLTEGMRHVFNANYGLLAYIKGNVYFNPHFMLSATIGYGGYGGYGRVNCGLGLYANFKNGIVVYAGSNNIEGYIARKTNLGQGVYVSLIKNFR